MGPIKTKNPVNQLLSGFKFLIFKHLGGEGGITRFVRDPLREILRSLNDPSGGITRFARDPLREILRSLNDPSGGITRCARDPLRGILQGKSLLMRCAHELFLFSISPHPGKPGSELCKTKIPSVKGLTGEICSAEKEGFEPPVQSPGQRFSRPPRSTTLPFLHEPALTVAKA